MFFVARWLGVEPGTRLPVRPDRSRRKRVRPETGSADAKRHRSRVNRIPPPPCPSAETIRFYGPKGPYGALSNFFVTASPIVFEEREYASSEHIFQTAKFIYPGASSASVEYGEAVARSATPAICLTLARQKVPPSFL